MKPWPEIVAALKFNVIGADSYIKPAVSASRKIIDTFSEQSDRLTVAASNSRAVHPFPKEWRSDAYSVDALPILNESGQIKTSLSKEVAHCDLITKLTQATKPVTLVFTGPLTDLARALAIDSSIEHKIEKLLWMGGSFLEHGNVAEPDSDGTAEWNAFWDPEAVKVVFDTQIPIELVSLESTNNVPLTPAIRQRWASKRANPLIDFLGTCYTFVPQLVHFKTNSTYYLWDVLTTCYLLNLTIGKTKTIRCDVIPNGIAGGRTFLTENGRLAKLVYDIDADSFFDLIETIAKVV
ncbi:nucleoside hydrolase [Latilactobacillus graminis]|uniref:Inosine-uridine preferring nucleoside hydrolase family protein n=2 Tax=Latilactobacillus graminis TaxID=60519 RepID=A0AA89I9I9_9LACO|nr:nucleoside hydrolase [Latilactobacillus graminis]KRM24322.1 inosine-uridine preferring nucleoside hydrolase family protein [Latilactobacillus graminis DSM 20719]QFP80122.1 ABC transporter substrate-binding protein [Latilactobacillus graminis]